MSMTNTAILDEVYRMLVEKECGFSNEMREVKSFIEREWQKSGNREDSLVMKMLSENPSKKWYTDVRDMERHRGLEIGPDGTVTDPKNNERRE